MNWREGQAPAAGRSALKRLNVFESEIQGAAVIAQAAIQAARTSRRS